MTVGAEPRLEPAATSRHAPVRSAAFGMQLDLGFPCTGLEQPGAAHADCQAEVSLTNPEDLARRWPASEAIRIGEDRLDDGTIVTILERHPDLGFRFHSPHFGDHLVVRAGRQILSAAPGVDPWMLERFIIGKALPLAAVLQGLEVFHASAVVLDDHVLACAGSSGTGKSSVATQLMIAEAAFFADDVVSVARSSSDLIAYPGANVINVRVPELERTTLDQRARLGRLIGLRDDRAMFESDRDRRALPLGGIYFLDRSRDWDRLALAKPPDARQFLACTYDTATKDSRRLVNLLELCALLAQQDLLTLVKIPRNCTSDQVAQAIKADWRGR
jgi:hypothetical protein